MYTFSPHIRRTTADRDGSIILDVREGVISKINPVGAAIWEMIERGMEDTEIVDALCTRFPDQSRDLITADVGTFVAELTRKDILQPCSTDAASGVYL